MRCWLCSEVTLRARVSFTEWIGSRARNRGRSRWSSDRVNCREGCAARPLGAESAERVNRGDLSVAEAKLSADQVVSGRLFFRRSISRSRSGRRNRVLRKKHRLRAGPPIPANARTRGPPRVSSPPVLRKASALLVDLLRFAALVLRSRAHLARFDATYRAGPASDPARRVATATLFAGANVSDTRHARTRREKLSITAWR